MLKNHSKSIIKYLAIIYFILIVPFICLFLFISNANIEGFAGAGYLLIYGGLIMIVSSIINIFTTLRFIHNNIDRDENKNVNMKFIVKFCLVGYLFSCSIGVIMKLLTLTITITSLTHYISYLFYPLFIPLSLLLLKREKLNRKTILLSILSLYTFYTLVQVGYTVVASSSDLVRTLLRMLPISTISFLLAILPFASVSLVLLNQNEEKNKHGASSFLAIIIAIALVFATSFGLNYVPNKGYISAALQSVKKHPYDIKTYMLTDQYLFYSASDDEKAATSPSFDCYHSIIRMDLSTKKSKSLVSNARDLYYFSGDKDNIYFTYECNGPLYQINKNGKITKIISSRNPGIDCFYKGYLYYKDFADGESLKRVNVSTKESTKINTTVEHPYVAYGAGDSLFLNNASSNDSYKTDFNFSKATLLNEQTHQLKFSPSYKNVFDNKIYFVDQFKLYVYNLNTLSYDYISKDKLGFYEYEIIGLKDNILYLYNSDSMPPSKVYYADINHLQNGITLLSDDLVIDSKYPPNIIGNFMYYTNKNDNKNLYSIDLTTKVIKKITNIGNCKLEGINDHYIYFMKLDTDTSINTVYRYNMITSEQEKLF